MTKRLSSNDVVKSSGDVFADLGIKLSDEERIKIEIARAIHGVIEKRGLTQTQAGKLIQADQSKVSALLRGQLKAFSTGRLLRYLVLLGKDVDIRISKDYRANAKGHIKVRAA